MTEQLKPAEDWLDDDELTITFLTLKQTMEEIRQAEKQRIFSLLQARYALAALLPDNANKAGYLMAMREMLELLEEN